MENKQKDFVDELNIETHLSPPHVQNCSVIDILCHSLPFDDIGLSTEDTTLPSPNQIRGDILSLWEEVAAQIIEPVAIAHRSLQEPTHLAHRVPSAERMPPRKRSPAHSWDRLSTGLLGIIRSRSAPSTPCGLTDCTADAWAKI